MATSIKSSFKVEKKYSAFYTGGKIQQSQDGLNLFCQNNDRVEILEIETGKLVKSIENEAAEDVTCFAVSPDDQMLVIAGRNLLLRQWDWKEAVLVRTWKAVHVGPISCMNFDETSTLLATGSSDSTIKVWDVIQKYCTHNLKGHDGVVSIAEFDPDISKLRLYSAADDYNIRVWDLKNSNCIAVLQSHYSVITAIVFAPGQNTFYSGGRDNIVTVWDMNKLEKQRTIPVFESVEGMALVNKESDLKNLNINSDHIHITTAGSKGCIRVYNTTTSQCVYSQELNPSQSEPCNSQDESTSSTVAITSMICNRSLNTVTITTYDHNILIYNMGDFSLKKQFTGFQDEVLEVKFVGSLRNHIAISSNSQLIKVFNLETWGCQLLYGHTDTVLSLDVSADKTLMASASKDNTVRVWQEVKCENTVKFECVAVGTGHTNTVQSVAFSRLNNAFLITGSQDLTLKIWPLASNLTGSNIQKLHAKITDKAHEKDINSIAVAPNDKIFATASQDKTAKLWRVNDLALVGVFRGHKKGIWCVQFSPIDQCLATASADGNIKIWALSDFSCVKTFEGHDASVLKVLFISRGMQLLTTGSDGLLKLWTIKTNECVKTYDEHEDKAWALESSENEDTVITGGGDSQIVIWKDVTVEEQEEIRAQQMDLIMKEQTLQNLLHQKKYLKAIGLAINLDQPFRVLNIMKEILNEDSGKRDLEKTISKLKEYEIDAVLRYASTWNTNSKHCHTAQFVVSVIFRSYTPDELFKLPNFKSSLEGLIPYTDRHCQRLKKLQQQSTFVEYTWQSMRLVSSDSTVNSILALDTLLSDMTTTTQPDSDDEDTSSHVSSEDNMDIMDDPDLKMEVDSSISDDVASDENVQGGEKETNKKRKLNSGAIEKVTKNKKKTKDSSQFLIDRTGDRNDNEDSAFDEIDSECNVDNVLENKAKKKQKGKRKIKTKTDVIDSTVDDSSSVSKHKSDRKKSKIETREKLKKEKDLEIRSPYHKFKKTGKTDSATEHPSQVKKKKMKYVEKTDKRSENKLKTKKLKKEKLKR